MCVLVTGGPDGEPAPGDAREEACRLPVAAVIVILQHYDPIERGFVPLRRMQHMARTLSNKHD